MENYELYLPSTPKRFDGRFQKGLVPHNKGVPMKVWMDESKIEKVLKYLELGRRAGSKKLAGANKIPVVSIRNGKLTAFDSSMDAARILRAKGYAVNARNIRACVAGRVYKNNGYGYIRKRAGGFQWFAADDVESYKHLLY